MAQAQQKPQPQAQPKPPVHKRRRRRRLRPQFIFTILFLTGILVGLMTLCYRIATNPAQPPPVTEPITTTVTEPTTEPVTTEPTTEAPTEPLTPTEQLELFASEHDLTLADYPEKILELYERNEEAREYCMNYPLEYGKEHQIDISGYADYEGVPLFIQWDKQWGYKDYIGSVGGLSACGPTCLSMVTYYFTRDPEMTPAYMMEFAEKHGYGLKGSGTQWSLFKEGGEKLGLDMIELTSEQMRSEQQIAKILDSGRIIVMNVKPGVFTTVGHYMLVVGHEDGKLKLNDPNSPANSERLWDLDEFVQDIKIMWAFKG
jgi:hypothetical protein